MASKGRPFRTVTVDGFEILIGKGDQENDLLTFEVAAPADLWLHVAGGVAGSHVVIRKPDDVEVPAHVVSEAATLAARYSKACRGTLVEVHLCRVADVHKPRGFAPGKVRLTRWTPLRVRVDDCA